jgi:hypothetical protein
MMILPELLLSTSLISLAIFVWAVIANLGQSANPRFTSMCYLVVTSGKLRRL